MRQRLLLLLLLLSSTPSRATTYIQVADESLTDGAALIGVFEVLDAGLAPSQRLATDYRIRLLELVKGDSRTGSTIVVRLPGGEIAEGEGLRFWGVPVFEPGERVLLFLRRRSDRTWGVAHLILGAFRSFEAAGREVLARPHLGEAQGFDLRGRSLAGELKWRDRTRFVRWLQDRVAGTERRADYFVDVDRESLEPRFTLIRDAGTNIPLRWFDFGDGDSVEWVAHRSGQPGMTNGGFGEARRALAVWNEVSGTDIDMNYGGQTSASAGFAGRDGSNTFLWNDLSGDIDDSFLCFEGGILTIGGPRYFQVPGGFKGKQYFHIFEGEVITNRNIGCYLLDSSLRLSEILAHEIGHALGFGHSCGDSSSPRCSSSVARGEALMRATVHNDGRGARIGSDDRAAARAVYGSAPPPKAPTDLILEFLGGSIRLTWTDRSNDEDGFRVYRRRDGSDFEPLAEVSKNGTSFIDLDLDVTSSQTYEVRSYNESGESSGSNRVTIDLANTSPGEIGFETPTILGSESTGTAIVRLTRTNGAAGSKTVTLSTGDLSAAAGLDYETKQVSVTWTNEDATTKVVTVPIVNDFSAEGTELVELFLTSFQVGQGPSVLLETGVIVIEDDDDAPGCEASDRHLCLLESRFKVEVEWRNQRNGNTGFGTAIEGTNQSGLFWFFSPDNVELIVKSLDGRSLTGAHWLFYGALSDVEYWITVTDTASGARRLYRNEPGNICGLGDTLAFPEPGAPGSTRSELSASALYRSSHPSTLDGLKAPRPRLVSREACVADDLTLCLLDGRFEVSVDWRNHRNSDTGVGTAVPFSDESGFFWFFDSDNIELVVKSLDGQAITGGFWFFYGALSDVEYTIKVTDTATGVSKEYANEGGNICGLGDTAAFPGDP